MIISNLLTKYILASFWMRILIALLFYLIVRQLHFIDADFDFGVAECMPRKKSAKILYETKEEFKQDVPLVAESKDQIISRLEQQIKDLTYERTGLRNYISKRMKELIQTNMEYSSLCSKLENQNTKLKTRLQETLEQNRQIQEQLTAVTKAKKRIIYQRQSQPQVFISEEDLERSFVETELREKEKIRLDFLHTQEQINKQVQNLLFGHGVEEALAYVKKKQTFSYLDYLNFFSFESADPLEDYFYDIHRQHIEASNTYLELQHDLNGGILPDGALWYYPQKNGINWIITDPNTFYLRRDFTNFKELIIKYKQNNAKLQLEFKDNK